jgi:Gram-negative bacterial TonB protein C-terminal
MQSSRSEIFTEVFRNPSVLAMIGSVAAHGVLVLFSAMKPADSLPAPLQVISLDPGSTTTNLNALLPPNGSSSLPVPNGLPPINLGNVPELSALPDISKFRNPSQSVFLGSDPSAINFGKLSIANPPQKSVLGAQGPVYGLNLPKSPSQGGAKTSPSPFGGSLSGGQLAGVPQPDYSRYALNPNPTPPSLSPGSSQIGSGSALAKPYEPFSAGASPSASPNPAASGNNAAPVRASYTGWLAAQSQAFGQPISTQPGPRLTAEYPSSACSSKVQGSASIAAVFGPDGSIAKGDSVIQVLQSAETQALNRAAIAAVESYRIPSPSGIPQALNFTVDIPYSEAVCKAESTPEAPIKSSPSLKNSKPVSTPTNAPSPASKEEILNKLAPKTPTSSSSFKAPSPSVSSPQAQSPEPLPTPSITVPEASGTAPLIRD